MSKKESNNEEPREKINLPRDLLKAMFGNWNANRHLLDQVGPPPAPTKSWLQVPSSKPCIRRKQPQYPQLTQLPIDSSNYSRYCTRYDYMLTNKQWHVVGKANTNILNVTYGVSRVDRNQYYRGDKMPFAKHEITTPDRFSSENLVMEFTDVVECEGKFYALSLQGSLVVMEVREHEELANTGICKTRAVPSCSISAKYFDEYLIESRGEVLLVFLIYREKIGVVDEVEVFRVDGFELVKVDSLGGRTLLLEMKYRMWVDSREVGCKGDCVYCFRDEKWWMYDLRSKSVSTDEPVIEY